MLRAPLWVTQEKITEYEQNNPDHAGIGRIMVERGIWRLTDDPRLNCRPVVESQPATVLEVCDPGDDATVQQDFTEQGDAE